ncbi:ABC transporter ATP-binding protein [Asticcacaulis sp. 201]|uniref:ABC transporter ATP-binding protein n=1 Tax=Asticcacaulis sp. 201 TaxID=3028787 RepID=UPI002916E6D3|nr:ABC transporter ATP-binding protein [Asticcacaulis sp. 201]MDV6331090.1 ABC transporter ATP-binding protein [Asticcacaulis sp. 201]
MRRNAAGAAMANALPSANKATDTAKLCVTLARFIFMTAPRRFFLTAGLLLIGGLTESLSLVMLLPFLHFMGGGNHSTHLSIPTGFLSSIFGPTVETELWVALAVVATVIISSALITRARMLTMSRLLLDTLNKLRMDLFRSIASTRWTTFSKMRVADLDHVLTGDIDRVQQSAVSIFMLFQNGVFLIIYTVLSCILSLKMTAFAVVMGFIVFLIQAPIRKMSAEFGDKLTRERQTQYRTINDFLLGLKVTKSYNAEQRYVHELGAILERMKADALKYSGFTSLSNIIFQSATAVVACVFIYASYAVYKLDVARIVLLLIIFMRLAPRFSDIQTQLHSLFVSIQALSAMQKVVTECEANKEEARVAGDEGFIHFKLKDKLSFSHVRFSYGNGDVLKDVSFDVPANKVTAVIGPSGGGKSTIADLAMGFITPQTGHIAVDGSRLDGTTSRAWRDYTAYVPQDTYLLPASIADNLRIARPTATAQDIRKALLLAQAEFVYRFPKGIDTIVGDGAQKLSGGERQRIAVARALLKKPDLLILDEATSALDANNTDWIVDMLTKLSKKVTILLITHNPAVLRCAHRVITVQDGTVAEMKDVKRRNKKPKRKSENR